MAGRLPPTCVPTTTTFTDEYFLSEGPSWQARKQWADFSKRIETPEFFLFYLRPKVPGFSPHRTYIVPKRAFDPIDLDIVSRFLASGAARRPR